MANGSDGHAGFPKLFISLIGLFFGFFLFIAGKYLNIASKFTSDKNIYQAIRSEFMMVIAMSFFGAIEVPNDSNFFKK